MRDTGRRGIGLLAVAAILVAVAPGNTPSASAAKHRRKPACTRAQVAGKRVCLRRGARCDRFKRSAYLEAGFDCVKRGRKRVLKRATPAAVRQGRYIALPPSGDPTFRQALAAFDSTIAALPGVRVPAGTVGNTESGTAALRWLYDYRDRLTSAQRAVLKRALTPGANAQTVEVDSEGNAILSAGATIAGVDAHAADSAQVAHVMSLVPGALADLKRKGVRVGHRVTVSEATTPEGEAKHPAMAASPSWLRPLGILTDSCSVWIFPRLAGAGGPYLRRLLLHELTHCAQFEFFSSMGQVAAAPDWVLDGTAEYVSAAITEEITGDGIDIGWWPYWLRQPSPGLFTRAYDAIGFWSLLAQNGVDVFRLLGPLVQAGGSAAAYTVAVKAANPAYRHRWGTSLAMDSTPGGDADWTLRAPGARSYGPVRNLPMGNGSSYGSTINAKGADIFGLDLAADILHITSSSDPDGLLRDSAAVNHVLTSQMDFCVRPDRCKCPEGEHDPAEDYPPLPPGQTLLGYANEKTSMSLSITGEALDCEKKSGKGGGGDNNNTGPAGIQIRKLNPDTAEEPPLVGAIKKGKCSFKRGGFSASGSGGGYEFTLRIAGARKPGKEPADYEIPRGSSASYLQVRGPGGPYSSQSGPAGFANGGVRIQKESTRKRRGKRIVTIVYYRISVGMTPLYGSGESGIAVIPGRNVLQC